MAFNGYNWHWACCHFTSASPRLQCTAAILKDGVLRLVFGCFWMFLVWYIQLTRFNFYTFSNVFGVATGTSQTSRGTSGETISPKIQPQLL